MNIYIFVSAYMYIALGQRRFAKCSGRLVLGSEILAEASDREDVPGSMQVLGFLVGFGVGCTWDVLGLLLVKAYMHIHVWGCLLEVWGDRKYETMEYFGFRIYCVSSLFVGLLGRAHDIRDHL